MQISSLRLSAAWHANCISRLLRPRDQTAGRLANTTRFPEIGVSHELRAFITVRRAQTSFRRRSTWCYRKRYERPASSWTACAEQSTAPFLAAGAARRPTVRSRPGRRCKQIRGAGGSGIRNSERNHRVRTVEQLHHDWTSLGSPLHPEGSELQNQPVYAGSPDSWYVSRVICEPRTNSGRAITSKFVA